MWRNELIIALLWLMKRSLIALIQGAVKGFFIGATIFGQPGIAAGTVFGAIRGGFRGYLRARTMLGDIKYYSQKAELIKSFYKLIIGSVLLVTLTRPEIISSFNTENFIQGFPTITHTASLKLEPTLDSVKNDLSTRYTTCPRKDTNLPGRGFCIENEIILQDASLNKHYRQLYGRLSAKRKQELKLEERNWIKQRDTICALKSKIDNIMDNGYPHFQECVIQETIKRDDAIKRMLDAWCRENNSHNQRQMVFKIIGAPILLDRFIRPTCQLPKQSR